MSDSPGMGTIKPVIHRQNQNRPEGEQSTSPLPALKTKAGTPQFSGLAQAISSIPVHPRIQDLYLASSKEGASSIYPLEASVIVGRSEKAYQRGKWLELQERLTEEIAVAIIWLAGVDKLRALFELGKKKALPNYDHISTNTAWERTWGKITHVDLSPQEMFTKNSKEIDTLLKLKSVRWLFSVGSALALVAYIIPKANQMKTDMILRHLNRRKRQTEGSNVQFGDPKPKNQPTFQRRASLSPIAYATLPTFPSFATGFMPGTVPPKAMSTTTQPFTVGNTFSANGQNPYTTQSARQSFQSTAPYSSYQFPGQYPTQPQFQGETQTTHLAKHGRGVQFGGLPGASLIQGLGHMVEQTPYGSILVVDAGIASGRGYVASQRSPFETVEVLFRDIGSLYFYILSAPHLMRLLGGLLNTPFGTSLGIQPKVAAQIHKKIEDEAAGKPITKELVEIVMKGATGELGDTLMKPEGNLKMAMRHASSDHFFGLLHKEAQVYLKDSAHPVEQLISPYLPGKGQNIDPHQIDKLLTAIEERHGSFAQLSAADRRNLGIAIKQAFRHTVGMRFSLNAIANEKDFSDLFQELHRSFPQEEINALTQRIERAAHLDNLNQTHSMLRRSLNVMHQTLGGSKSELFTRGDSLATWIDEAVNRHMTLAELIEHELEQAKTEGNKFQIPNVLKQKLESLLGTNETARLASLNGQSLTEGSKEVANAVLRRIHDTMQELTHKAPGIAEQTLLEHYRDTIEGLTHGNQGRLFSLAIEQHDMGLSSKLRELLKGGLENNRQFLHQALDIVGQLETDSRKFASTAKADRMRGIMSDYMDALLKKAQQPLQKSTLSEELKAFYNLNRNLHYGAWTVSMGITMACLGWLVPHLQTLLTKRLTGKDIHPGIASAEHAQEVSREPQKTFTSTAFYKPQLTHYTNGAASNRNQYAGQSYSGTRPIPYQGA